jgi:hypothetical protein
MEDKVDPDEVLVIIGRTDFTIRNVDRLLEEYCCPRGPWYDYDKEKIKDLLISFLKQGKIHQPRQYGTQPPAMPRSKVWAQIIYDQKDMPKAAQEAWDRFIVLASLYEAKRD